MSALAEVHWSGSPEDRAALALRHDWSGLKGLEQLWPELVRRYGEQPALAAPHTRPPEAFTYRQLQERIEQGAAGLAALGVGPGDVVALLAENGPRWLVADQALMRVGAADAVRGSGAPLAELRYILDDSGAVALVVESAALLGRLELTEEQRQRLRAVILLEDQAPAGAAPEGSDPGDSDPEAAAPALRVLGWQALLDLGATAPAAAWPPADPQRLATILYTSGTTGEPKGVPLTHANLLHQVEQLGVAVAPSPGDRVLSVLPIWHSYERSCEYFLLACGCTQTYTTLKQLRADLQAVRPQYLISVPRLWEALQGGFDDALAKQPARRQRLLKAALGLSRGYHEARRCAADQTLEPVPPWRRLAAALELALRWPLQALAAALLWPKVRQQLVGGALRTAISGGGALASHVDGFFEAIGIELLVGYGLTETSPVLTCRRPWCNRRGSAGQPLPGTALRVVDPERGQPLAIGERGLVLARGPQVMGGYWGKPEATARVLDGEGWFDTGDLGLLLADGCLVLTGRVKDTIVLSSGENIEPGPLEEALAASPLVEQLMVVGQDRKQLGLLLVPKAEALTAWATERGLKEPALARALTGEFNRLLSERPGARPDERLAGVALVEPFSIENGLLTQTLKQRRDRITDRDGGAIEGIYGG